MGTSKPQPPTSFPDTSIGRLDSWKEIAAYLKRDERTVRRWEREGLPVRRHMHKKQASIYAYKAEIDAWWGRGRQRFEPASASRPGRPVILWFLAGLVAAGLLVFLVVEVSALRRARWARNQALPEIARLLDQDKSDEAFRLALQAQRYIPNDPLLLRLLRSFTKPVSIQTSPPGADIYVRTYSASDKDWTFLGKSPLANIPVPWDYLRLRIEKPGFGTLEAASFAIPNTNLNFTLDAVGSSPPGMIRVPGGPFQLRSAAPVELRDYWLDQYEVTNRQFKHFMENGGYQNRTNWTQEFVKDGRHFSWEEAMAEFRDPTGRTAPSTWELGSYPDGQADFPVGGVSWYEAAAYCEFEGKSLLPSITGIRQRAWAFPLTFCDSVISTEKVLRASARIKVLGHTAPTTWLATSRNGLGMSLAAGVTSWAVPGTSRDTCSLPKMPASQSTVRLLLDFVAHNIALLQRRC